MNKVMYIILIVLFFASPAFGLNEYPEYNINLEDAKTIDASVKSITTADNATFGGNVEATGTVLGSNLLGTNSGDRVIEKTFLISPSGGDYTTIQAALTANATTDTLFVVYPGTYANDTINFTANNQYVEGTVSPKLATITNTTTICNYGAYTGCIVDNIKMVMTVAGETELSTVDGSAGGSCNFKFCHIECVSSGNNDFANSGSKCFQGNGTVKIVDGSVVYTNNATRGNRGKKAILIEDSSVYTIDKVSITASGSGTSSAFACIRDNSDSGTLLIDKCTVDVEDNDTDKAYGLNIDAGAGEEEVSFNNIHVSNSVGDSTVIRLGSSSSLSVRSMYNHFHADCGSGKKAYTLEIDDANTTAISQFDDLINGDGVLNIAGGTYTYCNSASDGTFQCSGIITGTLPVDSVNTTMIDWGTGANQISQDDVVDGSSYVQTVNDYTETDESKVDHITVSEDIDINDIDVLDLDSGVQTSLGKADTALQSITSMDIALAEDQFLIGNASGKADNKTISGDILFVAGVGTIQENAVETSMINLDAVTMDGLDADGDFETLTGDWYTTGTLASGSLAPITDNATTNFAANFTGKNLYGGTFVCDVAGTIQLPLMVIGMNFTVITLGDIEVVIDTNANDGYLMDGVTGTEGKNITNLSSAGDIAVLQYYTADDWLITTNGWTAE